MRAARRSSRTSRRTRPRAAAFRTFNIATPLDDVTFRFIQRDGDYPHFAPGLRDRGRRKAEGEPARFRDDRPRDVERLHDAPRRELVPRRARLHALLGRRVPHRRDRGGEADGGLGPPLHRHGGPGQRREVRHERADASVLPGEPDQPLLRGPPRRRRPARRLPREGDHSRRRGPARPAASSSCPPRAPTTTACRSAWRT